ncbi:MAG: tRNA preQ1(34) S-adenosylmethionine ribosyltransferase-isomerase QueA [Candidatus Bostrichicola ureolyticus]|nr:MAG: tRNA preQ1(34) S-adenosylmethionine ribosyltransferase-isomerase QueA [Candidatus Bostrichicola ureolyticus]
MKTSDFNFEIPKELIVDKPTEERDESRLMVIHKDTRKIEHKYFKNIIDYFNEGDVIILNNTKVFPARLYGIKEKTEAKIEVFLLRELDKKKRIWDILVDPARKVRIGNKIHFSKNFDDIKLIIEIIDNTTSRGRIGRFNSDIPYDEFINKIKNIGETPLPKYIKRNPDKNDIERYQTIYAKIEGSVSTPSAGLHFSKNLLKKLEIKGIKICEITLHIGLGNLILIEVEDISKHRMDTEQFFISQKTCDIINNAIINNKRICAVGSSSIRALESSCNILPKSLKPINGWTSKFIFHPYDFKIVNSMITNFHMPKSTLLMLVVAFSDYNLIMEAYNLAIKENYRFFSYGDAMLIL